MRNYTDGSSPKLSAATSARQHLRQLMRGQSCIMPASIFDPISARIAHHCGVDALMLSGSVAAMVILGDPDLMTLSSTELSGLAGRIARATPLPVIVDADHGFGNALNVRRTVADLEREGVAALTLEDTVLPLPFQDGSKPNLVPMVEAVGKLKAALDARVDPDLLIIARTGAAGLADMADTTDRLKAYADAGADMVFISGVKTREQIAQLGAAVDVPIAMSVTDPDLRDLTMLGEANVRIVLPGQRPLLAAYKAVMHAINADQGGAAHDDVMTAQEMRKYTRHDAHQSYIQSFMTPPDGTKD